MTHKTKRYREIAKHVDVSKTYTLAEAVALLKKCPSVKFDQSIDVALKTGIDARKSDQQVRGTVSLPHGTGKQMVLLVFARGEKIKEALDAGADFAGNEDLLEKVKGGWVDFDVVISTPDMMREVGKLGKVLGPRGLMPTPKAGTVTTDVVNAINEVKGGKMEFKGDKNGVINAMVGKLSFEVGKICENIQAFVASVVRVRPSSTKGDFLRSLVVSSTMGPGLKIDLHSLDAQGAQ